MTTRIFRRLACIISMAVTIWAVPAAHAEILNGHIAINPPTGGAFVESTSITTMAYVTNSPIVKATYIEIIGNTATGGFQLRVQSKDQTRVLAFWDQIAKAAEGPQQWQITAYAVRTF